jgi:hypothetical protein
MGQDSGRVWAASYAGTSKAQTPDQRRRNEENHRRHEKALAFAEGGCEIIPGKERCSGQEGGGEEVVTGTGTHTGSGADCRLKAAMKAGRYKAARPIRRGSLVGLAAFTGAASSALHVPSLPR